MPKTLFFFSCFFLLFCLYFPWFLSLLFSFLFLPWIFSALLFLLAALSTAGSSMLALTGEKRQSFEIRFEKITRQGEKNKNKKSKQPNTKNMNKTDGAQGLCAPRANLLVSAPKPFRFLASHIFLTYFQVVRGWGFGGKAPERRRHPCHPKRAPAAPWTSPQTPGLHYLS